MNYHSDISSFPMFKKINSTLVSNELIAVVPMSAPIGKVFYMDYEYGPKIKFYPFLVNSENIVKIREDFFRDDVMIGDVIIQHDFDDLNLKGEMLLRDGKRLEVRVIDSFSAGKTVISKITSKNGRYEPC